MSFYDAVLHLDSPDPAMLKMVLRNAGNYLNALPDENFSLQIVANAGAVTLFLKTNADLRKLAQPVLSRGVQLKICANAIAEHNLAAENIWEECEIVPAGLVEIVKLQKAGFSYIKP